ncbi:MAG TPA: flagellar basal body rod protein FlgB [Geminicoccaceae bacterium]|nr:flagellar basal body rod protein FlgB [Geminicoccaceae bacterium]
MLPTKAALFQLISARMSWLSQRQVVLNQNIANADTPDYRPRDLREADFKRLVEGVAARPDRLAMARTDGTHLAGVRVARLGLAGRAQRVVYEVAPDGNAVVLEEQTAKAAETALAYQLTSNLYRKYLGMVRSALGHQQS